MSLVTDPYVEILSKSLFLLFTSSKREDCTRNQSKNRLCKQASMLLIFWPSVFLLSVNSSLYVGWISNQNRAG